MCQKRVLHYFVERKPQMPMNYKSIIYLVLLSVPVPSIGVGQAMTPPEMAFVQGGTFPMGFSEYDEGREDELPVHQVSLDSYFICKYPVTHGEYLAFCRATEYPLPPEPMWLQKDHYPAVYIGWDDAVAYCKWLSKELGGTYRLPTEAEWEFAARGGQKGNGYEYSGSDALPEVGWYSGNSLYGHVVEVGRQGPNELDIYDMSGNVLEWCSDWYDEAYYAQRPTHNPTGPEHGERRVLRGGSYRSDREGCWVGRRYAGFPNPGFSSDDYGFRVVLELSGQVKARE